MVNNILQLKPGSMKASVFNLACISIGIGCLTIPYAIRKSGLILGIIWNLAGLIITYWSTWMIVKAISELNMFDFVEMQKYTFGASFGKVVGAFWILNFVCYFIALEVVGIQIISI
jgi:amino acid permease